MDISGLSSVTTAAEMQTWLTENCVTPIRPAMSGEDFGAIMQKIIDVGGGGTPDFSSYLTSLPGYVGDGSKILSDDLTWRLAPTSGDQLSAPSLAIYTIGQTDISCTWNSPTDSTGFILQRASNASFTSGLTVVFAGTSNQFDDTGLTPLTQYYYRIKCTAADYADSPFSNVVVAKTAGPIGGNGTARIVFTNNGSISEPGWNNFDNPSYLNGYSGWTESGSLTRISPVLLDTAGNITGWKLSLTLDTGFLYNNAADPNVRPADDFPQDTLITQWVNPNGGIGSTIHFVISGLEISKSYHIETLQHDGGASLNVTGTWGSVTESGDQAFFDGSYFVPLDLNFSGIAPDVNGNITGTIVANGTGNAVINAMIISEA